MPGNDAEGEVVVLASRKTKKFALPAREFIEHILCFDDLTANDLLAQTRQVGMTPRVIAQFKVWIRGEQESLVHVCPHPIAAHEEGGGGVVLSQYIVDASIEPRGIFGLLT